MRLTRHARRRMKTRVAKNNINSIVKNVKRYGLKQHQFSGRLRGYLNHLSLKHRRNPIVYKGNVYCISGGTIITVFTLPDYLVADYEEQILEIEGATNEQP